MINKNDSKGHVIKATSANLARILQYAEKRLKG